MPEAVPLRPEAYDADGRARPLLWQAVAAAGNIWPNPARGYFWVRLPDKGPENALIQILDAGGHVVWTQRGLSTSGGIAEIQPGNLPAGWYAVQANGQLLGSVLFQ